MTTGRLEILCDRVLRWGLVFLIAYTPLAFGTVEAWAIAIMEWGIWTLVLVGVLRAGIGAAGTLPRPRARTGLEIPVALFVAFCGLQLVPIPVDWLRVVSPRAAAMYATVDVAGASPVASGREKGRTDGLLNPSVPGRRPLTVSPADTFDQLLLIASFTGLFGLVAWWSRRPQQARFLLLAVTISAFFVSLFGLFQYLTWNGKIYWFRRIPSKAAFGPFVNHNHFAGYVGMVIPIALCLALYLVEERRKSEDREELFSERWVRAGLALFGAALLVVALCFSMSRGGILSSALGGLVLFLLASRRLASRAMTWSVAGILVAVVVGFIAWIGADVVSDQLRTYGTIKSEASFRQRAVVWGAILENVGPFLGTGAGLGSFEDSFASFTPNGSGRRWDRAHNDYLQLLWETGLPGALLFLAAAAIFIRRYWWPALRASGGEIDIFRLGTAIGLLTIALHSIVDFNLQIGANGFLFALLSGALVGMHQGANESRGAVAPGGDS